MAALSGPNLSPNFTLAQASLPLRLFWLFRCSSVSCGKLPFLPQLAGRVPAPRRNVQGSHQWWQAGIGVQGQRWRTSSGCLYVAGIR